MIDGGLERLLRLERGELDADERREVLTQVEADAGARTWLAWIGALRQASDALEDGGALQDDGANPELPDLMEIAALAQGTLGETRAAELRAELARHPDGYALFESAIDELQALRAEGLAPSSAPPAPAPAPRGRLLRMPQRWIALAAGLLIAVGLWFGGGGAGSDLERLARREALNAPVLRTSESSSAAYERGIAFYRDENWPDAARELQLAGSEREELGTAWLYLGSSRLLLGEDRPAAEAFERAVLHCEGGYQMEALWQHAQALLAVGDREGAVARLTELSADGGHRREDAQQQLRELEPR